jgi:hypothetical protein
VTLLTTARIDFFNKALAWSSHFIVLKKSGVLPEIGTRRDYVGRAQ